MFPFEKSSCINIESGIGGRLLAMNNLDSLPFSIKRIFVISDTEEKEIRGGHAHKECWQALIVTDGLAKINWVKHKTLKMHEMKLDWSLGIFIIPPLTWIDIQILQDSTQILVLASESYLEDDYIRDFLMFKNHTA
jgi:UDP-2-acetamido-3-amino-2,3-dideoxy-glucuronate N-acetyltransferase